MKCPKCQFENPEAAKFCVECGGILELTCPKCGFSNSPGFKFCAECGHNLSIPSEPAPRELSFDEKLDKIQRYLPKGLTEKILAQRDKIEGERKQVTVMFCDMEGFTSLTERLGPEEAYGIMDQVYEILIHKVHDYEGTVNEMTGDGIMALFGAPIALEDASQRAIRSSLAIHREMAKFSDKVKEEKEGIPPFKMRIGIHTGPVVVGTLGNNLRVEFKAVGDTVNLASRMEGLSEPGTTYVTDEIFKLTEGLFRFEALGKKEIKGKKGPVKVYRVIAPSTRRTRFDVSAERGLTPLVGRQRELELLLDGFERSKAGRGQAFSIMSEAGVGKSRLLYEFRKAVANENATILEGKCLSYSRGVSYHPVIDILKANFDIREGDEDPDIREKVQNGLEYMKMDTPSFLPYILELLSVKDSGIEKIMMSPEGKKDRIIETLKQILLKSSELRPLVMAIEDLHWADTSTEDVLKYLMEGIPAARILLIFTYRPEFEPTWGVKSYHNPLTINRLSDRESLTMAANLLGTDEIDRQIGELILSKTEGVPFFIEEFIKSLKDLNIIRKEEGKYRLIKDVQDLMIPSTIQDVIMARVDALPQNAKELIQTGSVIEREFGYELIKKVMGFDDNELCAGFSLLKDAELLYERGVLTQSTYIFKHALTREVVYDSLLAKKKRAIHEQIGKAIEEIYKDNLESHFGVLAAHFMEGENFDKGAEYSKRAMRKAEKSASINDAIAYARKRVACIEKLPQSNEIQQMRIDARTTLGLYIAQMNYLADAKEAIDPIIELAEKTNYKKRLCQLLAILGTYYHYVEEDIPQSCRIFEESLKIADEVQNIVTLSMGSFWFGFPLSFDCQFERAATYFQKAIDINAFVNNLWGVAAMTSNLAVWCHFFSGKIEQCMKATGEAVEVAEKSGDIFSKGMAYTSYGFAHFGKGFLGEAEKNLLKGSEFCERSDFPTWLSTAHWGLAETYFELGSYEKAKEHCTKGSEIMERSRQFPTMVALLQVGALRSKIMNREEVDLNMFDELYRKVRLKNTEGWTARNISEGFTNIDDQHMPEAEDWILKAIDADQRNGIRFNLGMDYAQYSEVLKRKGDRFRTQENLSKAVDIFKECGADGWVKKYEKEMATL